VQLLNNWKGFLFFLSLSTSNKLKQIGMKRLVLIRHGKADQSGKIDSDFERTLIKKGQKDAHFIAGVIKNLGVKPELLITSDAYRANETAEIFADVLDYPKDKILRESFLYDGYTTGQLVDFISEKGTEAETILIFGHNPFISQSGIRLSKNFHQSFPTSGCLGLKFDVSTWNIDPGTGEIDFFEFPKKYM
jgi:phosphohistidine phosphatase